MFLRGAAAELAALPPMDPFGPPRTMPKTGRNLAVGLFCVLVGACAYVVVPPSKSEGEVLRRDQYLPKSLPIPVPPSTQQPRPVQPPSPAKD